MRYTKFFPLLTFVLLATALPARSAAPSFDAGNLGMQMMDLAEQEGINTLLEASGEYVKTAQAVMGAIDVAKKIAVPLNVGTTPFDEWSPVVPKNVAKVLKEKEPKLADVKEEIRKIAFLDVTTPETLLKSKQQQAALLLKTLAYSYAAAERSLELSVIGYEENEAYRERVESENNVITLFRHMAALQMFSSRKIGEILNLQSRILEIDSMRGLMGKEKPAETKTDNKETSKPTDTPKTPEASAGTGTPSGGKTPSGGTGTAGTGNNPTGGTTPPSTAQK